MKNTILALTLSALTLTANAASEGDFGNFINIKDLDCAVFNDSPIDTQLSQCVAFSGAYGFIIKPVSTGIATYQGLKEGETVVGTIRYYLGATE